ncbi:NADH dehydrogenase [ubiquinone] 1 beta subcomplex subunit 10-like [Actinia tenebrosa]|uniref:NADH dehydrogenase [ubiquinone] 1 beta subcomplex subunit 10 n=1 Tax=Actinia tenebrosa TaxID=6105 RepID=A0A6P8H9V8_ACTTE|nr:NADH dehydrogenase [ubiquinone] 1 beta subcomplex subunit 10-like [Actinia tenebrosa]XP_031552331.1 NADH dehydrogenase [ubiquinone] 1 beta subcomplex subunit 10-like [Actinia tenebrosa]
MSDKYFKRYTERQRSPSFEEIDRKDPVAFTEAREQWVLDRLVELETVKIYRERVAECYKKEEVNARQNCRKEVAVYWKAFQAYKAKAWGYTPDGNWSKWKVPVDQL